MKALVKASKWIDWLAALAGNLSAVLILISALLITLEIGARTFFNRPFGWSIGVCVCLAIAATFLAASYVASQGRHVTIDLLTSRLRPQSRKSLDFVTDLVALALLVFFIYSGVKMLILSRSIQAFVAAGLPIPVYIPQVAVPVGAVLLLLQLIKGIVTKGSGLVKGSINAAPDAALSKPMLAARFDTPGVVISAFLVAAAGGVLLVFAGGNLTHLGIILLVFVFLFSGMPIFLGLATIASLGFFVLSPGILHSQLALAPAGYTALENFALVAIPLFILGGSLIGAGKMSDRLFDLFHVWIGRIPGSLAIASVLASAAFATMCGSGISGALTIGLIAIPAMIERGYDQKLAIGAVASAGTLSILIPPSIPMIVYGSLTDVSVGRLFMAGIFPGLVITALLCAYILGRCWRDPRYRTSKMFSTKEKIRVLKRGFPVFLIPLFVLGSIYTGTATPTEAAAVMVIFALVLGVIYRQFTLANLWQTLRDSMIVSSSVLMIFVGAKLLSIVTARVGLNESLVSLCVNSGLPPWGMIVTVNILILLLGCIFESGAMFMILTPILYPLVVTLGYDPLWFGILFIINIEVAQISPPVGIVDYALQAALNLKSELVMRAVLPFCLVLMLGLVIVGLFPGLATWLPTKMFR